MKKRWMGLIANLARFLSDTNRVTVFNAPGFKNTVAAQAVGAANELARRMAP